METSNWKDWKLIIGGQEIDHVNAVEFEMPKYEDVNHWEYYYRIGNRYYFRRFDQRMTLVINDSIFSKFMQRGFKYDIKTEFNIKE